MLKRRQLKIQPNNVTIVEEVSIAAKNDSGVVDGVQRLETECSKSITNESTANNMVQEENNEHKNSITQQRERQLIVSLCDKERAIAAQVWRWFSDEQRFCELNLIEGEASCRFPIDDGSINSYQLITDKG